MVTPGAQAENDLYDDNDAFASADSGDSEADDDDDWQRWHQLIGRWRQLTRPSAEPLSAPAAAPPA